MKLNIILIKYNFIKKFTKYPIIIHKKTTDYRNFMYD